VRQDEAPQLTTTYLAKENTPFEPAALPPRIVTPNKHASIDWDELWRVAAAYGDDAAARVIPTPMVVRSKEREYWVPEGKYGGARIIVRDARRNFGRWLRISGYGGRGHRAGATVYAPSHFVETAEAYAHAFAEVLRTNGVDCTVETFLD
jgi:hypothetical protein